MWRWSFFAEKWGNTLGTFIHKAKKVIWSCMVVKAVSLEMLSGKVDELCGSSQVSAYKTGLCSPLSVILCLRLDLWKRNFWNFGNSDFYWWYSSSVRGVAKAGSPHCRNSGGGIRAFLAEQAGVLLLLLASQSQQKEARNHTAGILVMTFSGCQNWFKIAFTQRAILQICIWAIWTS